jgi:hypothetical protein
LISTQELVLGRIHTSDKCRRHAQNEPLVAVFGREESGRVSSRSFEHYFFNDKNWCNTPV